MIKYAVIAAHAAKRPDGRAIVSRDRSVTWLELADEVARAATGLSELISAAKTAPVPVRAAFVSENRWEIPVLQGAAASIGLPLTGIDYSLPAAQVAHCLRQLRPAVLVVSPSRCDLVSRALSLRDTDASPARPPQMVLLPGESGTAQAPALPWAELADGPADQGRWLRLPFEGLGFTSGTTSAPKLVLRSQSFETRRGRDVTEFFGISGDDAYLNTVPLYHASGPGWARIFATHGAAVVLAPHDDPAAMLAALAQERITGSLMVPPVLESLIGHMERQGVAPGMRLRFIVTGGRHISPALARRTRRMLGDVLHVYYGTTETGLNTLTARGEIYSSPGTAGKPFPGNKIFVLDGKNQPLPAGEKGQIAVGSYMLADEYAADQVPVAEIAGETAWLTPDTGWLDPEGRLHVTARDLPSAARTLDVVALEGNLRDSLDVADAAVLADVRHGEPLLTIAFVPGSGASLTAQDVAAEASRYVNGIGIGIRACPVPAIPYSPTGKVRSGVLRELTGIPAPAARIAS